MANNLSHICNVRSDAFALNFKIRIVMRELHHNSVFCRLFTVVLMLGVVLNATANPTGMTVQSGSATVAANGSQLTITTSQNAFLNWQSFNIAGGETTIFQQPSATSIVWNRINNQNPSQIYGNLQANGIVVLLKSSGFYFGPNSFVSAAGLVISTANCIPPQNAGGSWEFNGPPPLASIVNYGQIKVGQGGSAFLIADNVENHGDIEAPGGTAGLAAGQTVLLSERPDGRGMSMQVTLPQGSVDNEGKLVADSGTIAMNAQVVNQNGLVQADSVRDQNGVIELVASGQLNLGANSQILARGDDSTAGSSGGNVTLQSGNTFSDSVDSQIITAGGAQGGNGGNIEVSAPNILSLNSSMNAGAQSGWLGGEFFLDPASITLGTSTAGGAIDVNTAFAGFSTINLQATATITLNNNTAWNLSASTGVGSGQLTLQAGGDIVFGNNSQITDPNNWSVTLQAGYNFANNTVQSGVGNIYLNGGNGQTLNGAIQTASGNINLAAGQNILVGQGYVITTGGGSINAHALAGNIDTGSDAQGYHFESSADSLSGAYDLNNGLGGISTAAGGDVNLTAGGNVTSVLPISVGPGKIGYVYDGNLFTSAASGNSDFSTAGSGAYGNQAGNVTIVAGGNVTGNYLVANGIGGIFAGVTMDANGNPVKDSSGNYALGTTGSAGTDVNKNSLALSLVSGGWNVAAAQNIILQEVCNPNGDFDVNGGAAYNNYFDYSPGDYVNLSAGNQVQLGASSSVMPRAGNLNVPVIYPPILNITAGAGGVVLDGDSTYNQLILFPSPEGSLTINTTQGGSLVGNLPTSGGAPQIFNLIVSDSGNRQYKSSGNFGLNDHAATPIHLGNPTPIVLNISGDMNLVFLGAPEAAQINVGGDMDNSGFQGMNLSANDVTSISVAGDINNRSAFTSVDLSQISGAQVPDLSYLSQALSISPSAATLATSFYYNPTTQILTYQNISGKSLASVLQLLQNLTIQIYKNGVPQWVDPYDTIPLTTTVSVLNSATAQALLNQYNALGGIPSGANGYTIGGGGKFDISARNMDLGTTAGIQSKGVGLYKVGSSYPLASLFDQGADINVNASGNLTMYSSSIASLNGGNIYVNAGGDINAGSADFSVTTLGARGIYSTAQGNVAVYANGDINVNGSRIAAYDIRPAGGSVTPGGSVTVISRNGNINAGSGGSGFVIVSGYLVDPTTHNVTAPSTTIPGSGILSTSYTQPGNTLVETPNGTINVGAGGISQLLLNGPPLPASTTLFDLPLNLDTLAKILNLALGGHVKAALNLEYILNGNPGNSEVDVYAGRELQKLDGFGNPMVDSYGNPVVNANNLSDGTLVKISDNRDIDATGSGVIGAGSVNLDASGGITGNIFALNNVNISAINNVNVSVFGLGTVNVNSAGGTISGTIIGVGGVSASGTAIDANLESNASVSGDTSGEKGLAPGTAADAASQGMASDNSVTPVKKTDDQDDEKKKKKEIALAQKTGRVTVILPSPNQPKT
jgi:filamentous hemagglutinin family protein